MIYELFFQKLFASVLKPRRQKLSFSYFLQNKGPYGAQLNREKNTCKFFMEKNSTSTYGPRGELRGPKRVHHAAQNASREVPVGVRSRKQKISYKPFYEDIPTINTKLTTNGPITRSQAKQIRDQVNTNLSLSYNLDLDEMSMLSSTFCCLNSGTSLKESRNSEEQSFNNKLSSYQHVFNKSVSLNTTSNLS
jgi:hypothetical protein